MKIFRSVLFILLCVFALASCQSNKNTSYNKKKKKPKCNTCPKWNDSLEWTTIGQ